MNASLQDALIKQQLEFTLSELEEYKKKEENLKKANESLLKALGQSNQDIDSHTIKELKKTIDVLQQENSELKLKVKELGNAHDNEKLEITLKQREIELNMKHQMITFESEKLKLLGTIQKLEAEKFSLSNAAKQKSTEKQPFTDNSKLHILELRKSFEQEKEELMKENAKIREDCNKSVIELKTLYESENTSLRNTVAELQKKLKQHQYTIEELKEENNEFIGIRTEELESEVEYYKELYVNSTRMNTGRPKDFNPAEKKELLQAIENINRQRDKLEIELERSQLDMKKVKLEMMRAQEKYVENERNLKNEIKILIGKLMKAKSKNNG